MVISNFEKFRLLLWKNWILQWCHKFQLVVELILPVLFTMLLVMVRTLVEPAPVGVTIYNESVPIDNIETLRYQMIFKPYQLVVYEVAYTPNTSSVLESIVKLAANNLQIAYSGYANPRDMEKALVDGHLMAGVQFDASMAGATTYPQKLKYTLRFPSEIRTDISPFLVTWWTNRVTWPLDRVGPRNRDYPDGGLPGGYVLEGFLPLQYSISSAFIAGAAQTTTLPTVVLQRYPYPPYIDDPLITSLPGMMGMVILLSYIYPCMCTVKYITTEKEKQLKEVMKIMGLQNWLHWLAWFVKVFLMMGFSAFLIAIVLTVKWTDNVAVLTYSSFTPVYFFLMVYTTTSITLCFMLATFFSRASTASAATGLIFLIMYLPNTMFEMNYDNVSAGAKIACSFISNTGMGLGLRLIAREESKGEGLQWNNLFTPATIDDDLSVGTVIVMMLLACVIQLIICLYTEQIYPGEFGVPKKWNFLFKRSFWVQPPDRKYSNFGDTIGIISRDDPSAFETEPTGGHIGIRVRNLTKTFGDKTVVNNLTMNMYENEITVLLGHNGAGKTTTISMLTGMFPPTSGTAIVGGYDIKANIEGARSTLGICPQHNILFDDLTVRHHLIFFARLKGLKDDKLEAEVNKYIKKIDLEKKANLESSKLSGGMKRKLSVISAFCGGTKVVLCDEPSSGMDPAARKQMWDLLQSEKHGRTVLLTTHFMDEADVLGDRIAIMSAGNLKCAGTSFFLKKRYGSGYHLICVKKDVCDSTKVTELLSKYVPNIEPDAEIGAELSYRLPEEYSSEFENMFQDLEINSDELSLNGYGVSITSLEEVFLKTGAEVHGEPAQNHGGEQPDGWGNSSRIFSEKQRRLTGPSLMFSQWRSMLLKKYLHTIRHKWLFAFQNFIPALFILTTFLLGRTEFGELPALALDLYQFPATVTVLETSSTVVDGSVEANIANNYKGIVHSLGPNNKLEETGSRKFIDYMLSKGKQYQPRIDIKYIVAATVSNGEITAWLNNKPLHSAPVTVNMVQNAIAKTLIGPEASISVINYPLPYMPGSRFAMLNSGQSLGTQIAINLSFCMSFISSLFVMFQIKERQSRAKLLQFVSGVRILTFWFSHFVWDILTLTITALVILITFICFQEEGYATADELIKVRACCVRRILRIILYRHRDKIYHTFEDEDCLIFLARNMTLIMIFCASVLPFTYLIGSFLIDPATGYAKLAIFNLFCGNAMFIVVLVMKIPLLNTEEEAEIIEKIFLHIPHFALAMALDKFYVNSGTRELCEPLVEKLGNYVCEAYPMCCDLKPYFGWEPPGALRETIYLTITGVSCLFILILKEYHFFHWLWQTIKEIVQERPRPRRATLDNYYDEDVEDEKDRVERMTRRQIARENLVLSGLTKHYENFIAVNQISLVVDHPECFGLLGVNGAGKTTTFKVLTGDEDITAGAAYVKGWSLKTDMNKVYQEIGYCPQFDALFDEFTGRETFQIYGLLRGIPSNKIHDISTEIAKGFGLMKHYDKQVYSYSGGNKRKLSTSIAVLGGPSVVYLDEPTSGMDPGSRRRLWNMICRIRDAGKSIILTSHSMEECEALCTRLAVMVNGEFKCIGSAQHLKNKFTKGLILKVKLKKNENVLSRKGTDNISEPIDDFSKPMEVIEDDTEKIEEFIKEAFPGAYIQERFRGLITFYIPLSGNMWSKIFGLIEQEKESLNIEDYSITQTTLEEIFLDFAKYQRDDPRENRPPSKSLFQKCLKSIGGKKK